MPTMLASVCGESLHTRETQEEIEVKGGGGVCGKHWQSSEMIQHGVEAAYVSVNKTPVDPGREQAVHHHT